MYIYTHIYLNLYLSCRLPGELLRQSVKERLWRVEDPLQFNRRERERYASHGGEVESDSLCQDHH